MDKNRGFFGRLFDISFSEFITTEIIKILYVLVILAAAIVAIISIVKGFSESFSYGIGSLIGAFIIFFVTVLISRVWLEILIVIFRIAEDTKKIVDHCTVKKQD